jgi:cell wall assembly regulator SMI1
MRPDREKEMTAVVTDLAAHVHELARQYVQGGAGTDSPAARIRVRMEDHGHLRRLTAEPRDQMPHRGGRTPTSMRVSLHADGARRWGRPSRETLDAVACAARAELALVDDADVVMELRVEAGEYEFRCRQLSSEPARSTIGPAVQLVLDPDYRYQGHPAPVTIPESALEPGLTDPQVLAAVRELVEQFTELYVRSKGRTPEFGPGYTEEQIGAAEARMGLRLPEDLRALYRVVHDDVAEHGLLASQLLFPLEDVVAGYLGDEDDGLIGVPEYRAGLGTAVWEDDLFAHGRVVIGGLPHDAARRVSHSARWVTLGRNGGGRRFIAVDLDPGPKGTFGQLFEYEYGCDLPVEVISESVTALLRHVVDAVLQASERGDRYEDTTGPRLRMPAADGGTTDGSAYDGRPPGEGLVASVAELTEPADVQVLELGGRPHIELAELAPLTRLRALVIRKVQTVDLALPHQVPVESLTVCAPSLDLAGLSGHPTLWDVTVTDAIGPVSIAPLTALSALERLNLSGLDVPDLELIATLPRLKVLVLDARQWRYLRERDSVPATLAAVELAGDNPFDVEAEWAAGFARTTADAVLRGRL